MYKNTVNKGMANFFYQQCAGSFGGHMGNVPNNPTLYGFSFSHSTTPSNLHAMSIEEFAKMLEAIAKELTNGL